MARKSLAEYNCSLARSVDIFGDQWSFLILREAFLGVHSFNGFRKELGISRNILTERLNKLADSGILSKSQTSSNRFSYELTDKGKEILPSIISIMQWGDKWLFGANEEPLAVLDKEFKAPIQQIGIISRNGKYLLPEDILFLPNSNKIK
jgi:DNA-binding HxlR family transcriptional regulator